MDPTEERRRDGAPAANDAGERVDRPEAGGEGQPSTHAALSADNLELRRRLVALERANADLQNVMASMPMATVVLDALLRVVLFTPPTLQLFDLIAADVGRPLADLTRRIDYPQIVDDARSVLSRLASHEREVRLGPRWLLARILPHRGAGAAAPGLILTFVDITDAKHARRESEERLRLVVENAREYAIVSMDLERRVTSWNTGAEELTGYCEAEVVGQAADLVFIEADRIGGAPERESLQALAEGRAADERWHRRKDGSRFWGSGVMMAMREAGAGAPVGLLKIFRDHTQARNAAQALETSRAELVQALVDNRRARTEAEAASHAKDRFLAILSHELRTPLTPVVMALHALERSVDLPAPLRSTVELIRRNVKAELMLIDDLLDVTRISTGKLEMARAETDMHEVVRAAANVCEADFAAKRQRLRLELVGPRHVVAGDASRLQQVIWNLLKNASKFTPRDGEIQVATNNAADHFVLVVADTGIGISAEALPLIFDAFAQEGQWVTSEFGGLGLGLAIAKATVEAHHGTLVAASAGRNCGATFTITLPLT